MKTERQSWERQPGESEPAYHAFSVFRDAGPDRSVMAVAAAVGKSRQLIDRWCQRWQWRERVASYDAEQLRQRDQATRDLQVRAIAEHLAASKSLLDEALLRLQPPPLMDAAGNVVKQPNGDPYLVPAEPAALNAAANALDKAIKHQRLALGLPTDVTRQDIVLREALQEALVVQEGIIALISEHLCEACRERVAEELRQFDQQRQAVAAQVSA